MARGELDVFLREVRAVAAVAGPRAALASVVAALAGRAGAPADRVALPLLADADAALAPLDPPPGWRRPEVLGPAREALLDPADRRGRGAYYTPEPLAAAVVSEVVRDERHRVCDPAAGGGAFLLAAARRLASLGAPLERAVACVEGVDLDAVAVDVARTSLALLGWDGRRFPVGVDARVRVGDALGTDTFTTTFDAVVTNPPFLGQLSSATARTAAARVALQERFGAVARGYADGAVVFLALALELVDAGGRVGIVLPRSVLASRDARPARVRAAAVADLEWLWWSDGPVFEAGTRVCAPVLRVRERPTAPGPAVPSPVRRATGLPPTGLPTLEVSAEELATAASWARLTATAPDPSVRRTAGVLGDLAGATAGFRDEYYGIVDALVDAEEGDGSCPPVVTSGLIDPARCLWGVRDARIGRRARRHPRVALDRVGDGRVRRWAAAQLVPKVLVATQTRTVEAIVDDSGTLVPCTPVIAVAPRADRLWDVAAMLGSPVVAAIAARRYAGVALAPGAIKLSASQVRALPAAAPGRHLDRAAEALRVATAAGRAGDDDAWRTALLDAAHASCAAYGVRDRDQLLTWWADRLPTWVARQP